MKYKLINIHTKEEKLCHKVMVDGFGYYVSDYIKDEVDEELTKIKTDVLHKISIATNNPNIDLPKIVDESELLVDLANVEWGNIHRTGILGYIDGYCKAKEKYQFTEQDMIEFANYAKSYKSSSIVKKAFDIWKSQQPITIYYQTTP